MSARDIFHNVVKHALEKQDWLITHDPLFIRVSGFDMSIDLGAEKLIAAEKNGKKIAIEIKSFIQASAIYEFHTALGQYLNYRRALNKKESDRSLYLAVPLDTFNSFFTLPFVQEAIVDYQIKLIVYDPENEVLEKWIN